MLPDGHIFFELLHTDFTFAVLVRISLKRKMTGHTHISPDTHDPEAFAAIVRQYSQMVWRICLRILGNADEAEDAVQETFIRAWKALPGYDSRYSMATWLGTIAARLCCDTLRKRDLHRRFESDTSKLREADREQDPESGNIADELERQFQKAIASLSPMQRTVFVLREIEQIPFDDIRKATGWSAVQIKSNLYIARQKVRKAIEKHLTE